MLLQPADKSSSVRVAVATLTPLKMSLVSALPARGRGFAHLADVTQLQAPVATCRRKLFLEAAGTNISSSHMNIHTGRERCSQQEICSPCAFLHRARVKLRPAPPFRGSLLLLFIFLFCLSASRFRHNKGYFCKHPKCTFSLAGW